MSSFDRPRHPGRTVAQREALDAIGSGQPPRFSHRTLKALLTAGLIVEAGSQTRHDVLGAYRPPVYEMPIPAHFQ